MMVPGATGGEQKVTSTIVGEGVTATIGGRTTERTSIDATSAIGGGVGGKDVEEHGLKTSIGGGASASSGVDAYAWDGSGGHIDGGGGRIGNRGIVVVTDGEDAGSRRL
ncbi:unnamed protein product [Ilex paraguariensis]|uniref:Uncharacterized protein n=2 Tax=Ilex paraguariensis TaxID=185542 RepID=A0ABC8TEX7_9AQUA